MAALWKPVMALLETKLKTFESDLAMARSQTVSAAALEISTGTYSGATLGQTLQAYDEFLSLELEKLKGLQGDDCWKYLDLKGISFSIQQSTRQMKVENDVKAFQSNLRLADSLIGAVIDLEKIPLGNAVK
jgi:hypothetical protein